MTICPAQLTSRSNSDLCTVTMIAEDTSLSPEARMELIAQVGRDWSRATSGCTARPRAKSDGLRKYPWLEHLFRNQRERVLR